MGSRHLKPSVTSLVAFFLVVSPVGYVLSYAPIVRTCGRKVEVQRPDQAVVFSCMFTSDSSRLWFLTESVECADSSVYPAYQPVDWLIDETGLREPLFCWAGVWGVREPFETGYRYRHDEPIGNELAIRIWDVDGQQ